MKKYLKLLRIHHYLKNVLILLPILFSGQLGDLDLLFKTLIGFMAFSFASSLVYIINDINDVEGDRKHPVKCNRPIASGEISVEKAKIIAILMLALSLLFNYYIWNGDINTWLLMILYIMINFLYSNGLKNIPLVDISILVFGYLLRVLYGSSIVDVAISNWLYLTVISMSFYLGLGKRRNEIVKSDKHTRKVLKYYNHSFLDKNMYMSLALTIVFYSLWCVDPSTISRHSGNLMIWTVPLVMIICMKYSLNIEGNSYGDPVDVLLKDKVLIILILLYGLITTMIIYMNSIISVFNLISS